MSNTLQSESATFVEKVRLLLSDMETWAADNDLRTQKSDISISEEALGTYSAPMLTISNSDGTKIAEAIPIATRVLGAKGRIDLKGVYDRAIIVDLDKGGPSFTMTATVGSRTETRTSHFYRGIDEDGWYWIERPGGKGRKLTAELLLNLLSEVSDYERQ